MMNLDARDFPFIWLRDEDGAEDEARERQVLLDLLEGGRRFVMIAERLPGLGDIADMTPEDRKARAQMFKRYKSEIKRLCAGIIMIGDGSRLPGPIRAAIEGLSGAMGVAVLFAADRSAALALGAERLAD